MKRRKVVQPLDWPIPSLHKPDYEYELGYEVSQAMFRPPVQPIHSHRPQQRGFSADSELSKIYTELWVLDKNRLEPEIHYHIDIQEGIIYQSHTFVWLRPLFKVSKYKRELHSRNYFCAR